MIDKQIMICPFCGKNVIEIVICKTTKASPYRGEASKICDGKNEILSEKCPNCGKSNKEIEKRMRETKTKTLPKTGKPVILTQRFD